MTIVSFYETHPSFRERRALFASSQNYLTLELYVQARFQTAWLCLPPPHSTSQGREGPRRETCLLAVGAGEPRDRPLPGRMGRGGEGTAGGHVQECRPGHCRELGQQSCQSSNALRALSPSVLVRSCGYMQGQLLFGLRTGEPSSTHTDWAQAAPRRRPVSLSPEVFAGRVWK